MGTISRILKRDGLSTNYQIEYVSRTPHLPIITHDLKKVVGKKLLTRDHDLHDCGYDL